jgi:hypothetical protein
MLSDEETPVPFCKLLLVLVEPKADWASMLMYVYDVGQKYGYKIKELNYQEGGCWQNRYT